MLKKDITFDGLDGPVTETYLFHLSKADLIELEFTTDGGLGDRLNRIVQSGDNQAIYNEFKKIVLLAVGTKSADGKQFIKTPAFRAEFEGSQAFSELLVSLLQDENAASEFARAILPTDVRPGPTGVVPDPPAEGPSTGNVEGPEVSHERRSLTRAEAEAMDPDELKSGLVTGRYVLGDS